MADVSGNAIPYVIADRNPSQYRNENQEPSHSINLNLDHSINHGSDLNLDLNHSENQGSSLGLDHNLNYNWNLNQDNAHNDSNDLNHSENTNTIPVPNKEKYITYGQMNLINDFRTLWRDLVIWMRSYQVSSVTGFSNIDSINKRLYRIPQIFNEKLQPFFGVEQSEKFVQLLLMFIVKAQILVNAQMAGNQQAADNALKDIYRLTEEMADHLARMNPYWSKSHWQYLLHHLTHMGIQEIIALIEKEYDKELDIRDRMLKHALILGDYMASGVMHYLVR